MRALNMVVEVTAPTIGLDRMFNRVAGSMKRAVSGRSRSGGGTRQMVRFFLDRAARERRRLVRLKRTRPLVLSDVYHRALQGDIHASRVLHADNCRFAREEIARLRPLP